MQIFSSFQEFLKANPKKTVDLEKEVFVYPTETFYALGSIANNDFAVEKIYQIKKRKELQPLLVLVESWTMLLDYAKIQDAQAKKTIQKIGAGSSTIVLKTKKKLSPKLNLVGETVAFRITNHPIAKKLIQFFQAPIVGSSANFSGEQAPSKITSMNKNFLQQVHFVIDGGQTAGGKPSSLLDFTLFPKISVLREGKLSIKDLKKILDQNKIKAEVIL